MNSKGKLKKSKSKEQSFQDKYTGQTPLQSFTRNSQSLKNSSSLPPASLKATKEPAEKASVDELSKRRMIGQEMYDYIVSNQLHLESITLIDILRKWKTI